MDISIHFSNTTISDVTKLPYRRLKAIQPSPRLRRTGACAFRGRRPTRPGSAREPEQFCVPARNPLGYVVSSATTPTYYAPALACKLRLVLHHIKFLQPDGLSSGCIEKSYTVVNSRYSRST